MADKPLLPPRFYQFNVNPVLQNYREHERHHSGWSHFLSYNSAHAIDRIKERYGVSITAQDWERLNWLIFREQSDAKFLFVKNADTTVYQVTFTPHMAGGGGRKRTINVMFSETGYCITTAIPTSDLRLAQAEAGEYKKKNHDWSRHLKRRYDLLASFQNARFRNYTDSVGSGAIATL